MNAGMEINVLSFALWRSIAKEKCSMDIKGMKVKDSSSLPKGRIVIDFDINKDKITVDGGGITEEEFSGIMLLILKG